MRGSEEGWSVLPEGRSLTLHVAKDGGNLTVSRVEAVTFEGTLLKGRTTNGEVFVLDANDVFAAAAVGTGSKSKKAGFV